MINTVWALSFLIESALLFRLIQWRVRLPMFRAFLWADLARSVLLWALDNGSQSGRPYLLAWKYTEPAAVLLIALVGAEAWKMTMRASGRYLELWIGCSVAPLSVGMLAAGAKFRTLLMVHAGITAMSAAWMSACLSVAIRPHVAILAIFCCIEFTGHAAIVAGSVCDSRIAAAVIIGETACLTAWLWHAKRLGPQKGLAPTRESI
jgi:hypothetical protein